MPEMGGQFPSDHASTHQDGGRDEISIASLAGESVNLAAHKLVLDAHTYNSRQALRTGQYFDDLPYRFIVADSMTADQIYTVVFVVARALTIDRIAIEVTTGDAGKIARLGIYADGTNLYPGALVKDYGTISVASTGIIAASGDQALTKGIYHLVVVSDGAPAVFFWYPAWTPLGNSTTSFDTYNWQAGWYKAGVGSAALANPFVAGASLVGNVPRICVRLKSLD